MTAAEYVRRVDRALRDLPWAERQNLAAELRDHLAELPVDADPVERLGAPEKYAADLRAAEGLERRHGAVAFLRARRPRNLVLAVLAAIVLVLAIGAVAWIQTYQPIAFDGATLLPPHAKEASDNHGESVLFHEGGRFLYGITITNNGSASVRVLGLTDLASSIEPVGGIGFTNAYPPLPFTADVLASSKPLPPHEVGPPYMRFRPFDLEPGDARLLILKGRYTNCHGDYGGGAKGEEMVTFPIRYRFLWRTATVRITLPNPLTIVFPKGNRCG